MFNKIVMNYTYEFSGKGMLSKSSGTHEVSIGILIGNLAKTSKKSSSVFESEPEQPYYEWLDK